MKRVTMVGSLAIAGEPRRELQLRQRLLHAGRDEVVAEEGRPTPAHGEPAEAREQRSSVMRTHGLAEVVIPDLVQGRASDLLDLRALGREVRREPGGQAVGVELVRT